MPSLLAATLAAVKKDAAWHSYMCYMSMFFLQLGYFMLRAGLLV